MLLLVEKLVSYLFVVMNNKLCSDLKQNTVNERHICTIR